MQVLKVKKQQGGEGGGMLASSANAQTNKKETDKAANHTNAFY